MSHMNVDLYFDGMDGEHWNAILMAVAPLNEQAADDGTFTRRLTEEANAEILMESTTTSGVPYVISKITMGGEADPVELLLYYGYESVLYELEVHACSVSEETPPSLLPHLLVGLPPSLVHFIIFLYLPRIFWFII